jgi:hypothetical protein
MSSIDVPGAPLGRPQGDWAIYLRRHFFLGMAVLATLIVFVGFAPSFYLRGYFHGPALQTLWVLHGTAFSAWMALLLTQSLLVRTGRVQLHRRLGIFGAILASVMLVLGVQIARVATAQGTIGLRAHLPPLEFLIIPLGQVLMFAALTAAALILRRRRDAHRRLMIVATIQLVAPAIVRASESLLHVASPAVAVAVMILLVAICIAHDWITRRRVHPVFAVLAPLTILTFPLRIAFSHTATWHSMAEWLVRGVQ